MRGRTPLSIEVKKVLKMLMYTLSGLLLAASAYFFLKTGVTAERGYQLRENQLRQKTLEFENRILKQRVLDAQSLSGLKESNVVRNLQEPETRIFMEEKGPLGKR